MREDHTAPSAEALRLLCRQAGRQAAGWNNPDGAASGAVAPTAAQRFARQRRLLKVGLGFALGAAALAVVAARFTSEIAAPAPPVALAAAASEPAAERASAAPATPGALQPIRWSGNELSIELDQVPLPEAVTLLAHATGTTVSGVQRLQTPVTVNLHLRTSDVASAWQHLLQGQAGYSLACAQRCQVAITAQVAGPAPAARAPGPGTARSPDKGPAGPEGSSAEEQISQPDGSC